MLERLMQTRTHQAKPDVSPDSLVGIVTCPRAGCPRNLGSLPGRGKRNYFSKASRAPPIQWITKVKRLVRETDTSPHLVPIMNAASPPLLHTPPWSAPEQIYLTCTVAKKKCILLFSERLKKCEVSINHTKQRQ